MINYTKGDFTNLVSESGCGLNYEPGDILATVGKILVLSDSEHRRMSENASRAFEEHYSFEQFRAILGEYVARLGRRFGEGKSLSAQEVPKP